MPFNNNNNIFKIQLNSMGIIIDLNKTVYYCLKCTHIKTEQHFNLSTVIDYSISASL